MPHPAQAVNQTGKPRPYVLWTRAQDEILRGLYPSENLHLLARRLGRSEQAIRNRAHRLKLKRGPVIDGYYTLSDLAANLCVDKRTISRWVRDGLLEGSQHAFTREWTFTTEQVAVFLRAYPGEAVRRFGDHVLWVLAVAMAAPVPDDDKPQGPQRRRKPGAA